MATATSMSILLYNRLAKYWHYLRQLSPDAPKNISSTVIGAALDVNDVQVRKDLALVSNGGMPKIGYKTTDLLADLTHYLGYDNNTEAVLVGVGNLGKALLSYDNFKHYGLKIVAAFDNDPNLAGKSYNGVLIMEAARMVNLCQRLNIHIGIIAVPASCAQDVCDRLTEGGIRAIWNFAPVNLKTPKTVVIRNEDMAASLAVLTRQLEDNIVNLPIEQKEG